MSKKYMHKGKRNTALKKILKLAIFVFLSYMAIKLGMVGGDEIAKTDYNIVENIDVQNFKLTLDSSLPIIYTVYNSGNISVSFSGEIKNIVKNIFGFDLNSPVTVLNSQSSFFYSYYSKDYLPKLAEANETKSKKDNSSNDSVNKIVVPEDDSKEIKEPASSITYEEPITPNKPASSRIAIQNETNYKVNIAQLLSEPLKIDYSKSGPKVLIYHTHTSESYIKSTGDLNKKGLPNWSTDPSQNVVRVGQEIAQYLEGEYDIDVIHNGTVHDRKDYLKAYSASFKTITQYLKSYPSIKVTLDIHRDGLPNRKLRRVTQINNKNVAQIMFVVGTDASYGGHPKWKENLKFALKIQQKLNAQWPGLARDIYLHKSRFNQQLTTGSLIVEVGGDGNTMEECLESTKYLSKAISDVFKDLDNK
ncbi:MAG: stage II sporulation protein P [Clostridia bacterium]|nr:stage II sporulation protein P [Clostridia bacterium]